MTNDAASSLAEQMLLPLSIRASLPAFCLLTSLQLVSRFPPASLWAPSSFVSPSRFPPASCLLPGSLQLPVFFQLPSGHAKASSRPSSFHLQSFQLELSFLYVSFGIAPAFFPRIFPPLSFSFHLPPLQIPSIFSQPTPIAPPVGFSFPPTCRSIFHLDPPPIIPPSPLQPTSSSLPHLLNPPPPPGLSQPLSTYPSLSAPHPSITQLDPSLHPPHPSLLIAPIPPSRSHPPLPTFQLDPPSVLPHPPIPLIAPTPLHLPPASPQHPSGFLDPHLSLGGLSCDQGSSGMKYKDELVETYSLNVREGKRERTGEEEGWRERARAERGRRKVGERKREERGGRGVGERGGRGAEREKESEREEEERNSPGRKLSSPHPHPTPYSTSLSHPTPPTSPIHPHLALTSLCHTVYSPVHSYSLFPF
ncbi:hypothetical protein C7M84_017983 [Penaeus vannamei]|uniref:Uncharacterized protein n=1 Tax=Penaeus vannamei TaxID=6689 RepID=A0A423SIR3_PENVA|nr:hypothetical protein C7M84_017983 [Penaeus vannamei]